MLEGNAGVEPESFVGARGAVRALAGKPALESELRPLLEVSGAGPDIDTTGREREPGGVARLAGGGARVVAGEPGRGRCNTRRRRVPVVAWGVRGRGQRVGREGRKQGQISDAARGRGQKVYPGRGGGAVALPTGSRRAFPWKARGGPASFVCVGAGRIFTGEVGPGLRSLVSGNPQCCVQIVQGRFAGTSAPPSQWNVSHAGSEIEGGEGC